VKYRFALTMLLAIPLVAMAEEKKNTAIEPAKKNPERHEGFLKTIKSMNGKIDVVFNGDSITDGWRGNGKDAFKEHFEPLHTVNIGIGGDRTQHLIWRMQNGELDGYTPKVMMLMIGTNNLGSNSNEEIAEGIKAVVNEFHKKHADAKVLLLGIFPRGASATDKARDRIKKINEIIAKMDDGKKIKYLDIGGKFLEPDGSLSKEIMYDFLHLSKKGYGIWADAVKPVLVEMMK
jgi:beta-glucosidase